MPFDTPVPRLALTTKTLGHPARLRILAMLRHSKLSVCQIAHLLKVAPSTASGYLLELRRAELVTEQRRGKWVYYRLTEHEPTDTLLRFVLKLLAGDPQVALDEVAARALNGTPPDTLCTPAGEADAATACAVEE